jgi:hypothetical protein
VNRSDVICLRTEIAMCVMAVGLGAVACAAPPPSPAESVAAKVSPLVVKPLAIIPASQETTAATGISRWAEYSIRGATVIGGWGDHRMISFVRAGVTREDEVHLDFGKQGGLVVFDKKGNIVSGYAGATMQTNIANLKLFVKDVHAHDSVGYSCTSDVIIGGFEVVEGALLCAPLAAMGPIAPLPLAGCLAALGVDFGEGVAIGQDCDGVKELFGVTGPQDNPTVFEICEGDGCDSFDPAFFEDPEDDGAEGAGSIDDGSGGIDSSGGVDDGSGGTGGIDDGSDPGGLGDDGSGDGGGDPGDGGGCARAGVGKLCKTDES